MSTRVRGQKRASPTTIILILVLLGAVAGASRLVTPPPPGPPVEVKQASASPQVDSKQMQEMEKKERQKNMEAMKSHFASPSSKIPKVEDPSAIVIDNKWFLGHKPGEEGLKQADIEQKAAKAKYAEYMRKLAAAQGTDHPRIPKPEIVPKH